MRERGKIFDEILERLTGPTEIFVESGRIAEIAPMVRRPPGDQVIDLTHRTVIPGLIDTHVHLTMDAFKLATQTHGPSATRCSRG